MHATSPTPDGALRPVIAYVAYAFPVLTQTFTVREVVALRERGLDVRVFAVKRDPDADHDPEAAAEACAAHYLRHAVSASTLAAAVVWALRRPARFLATLAACLGGGYHDEALKCRMRAVFHFLCGTALASHLRRDGGFSRVHAQFVDAGSTVAFTAARLTDVPFSFANHTAYNPYLLPAKARHADVVISISEFDRARVEDATAGHRTRATLVVNRVGVRLGDWHGLERDPEPGRVLIVGGLRDKKGHGVLLRAAAELAARGIEVRVRVAGGGPAESRLRDIARDLAVDAAFLGPVSPTRVRGELARAALFVLPCCVASNGDLDGIPVSLMEAMAAGVPVVSTRLSGIPELVQHGVSGLLAEPDDATSLADAMERMLGDPGLAEELSRAAVDRVAELHDIDCTSAGLAKVLAGAAAWVDPASPWSSRRTTRRSVSRRRSRRSSPGCGARSSRARSSWWTTAAATAPPKWRARSWVSSPTGSSAMTPIAGRARDSRPG